MWYGLIYCQVLINGIFMFSALAWYLDTANRERTNFFNKIAKAGILKNSGFCYNQGL